MNFQDIEVPAHLETCRNVWLYLDDGQWVISTRSEKIASFQNEIDALAWWKKFESARGFTEKAPKRSKPPEKRRKSTVPPKQSVESSSGIQNPQVFRPTLPEHGQALLAKINQGRYDDETSLLRLMKNASERGEEKILNAVHQRLKIVVPETYRKLVGPLHVRDPLGNKQCYCGQPASLSQIADEIITDTISEVALLCDACWDQDICSAWGYYGAWGAKIIDTHTWTVICERRGDTKYATY